MKKITLIGEEAREKLINGILKISEAVTSTLGPYGKNAIIDRPFQNPLITNDGVTVAKEIVLDDEIEELGAKVVKEATKKTNDQAGDGTTTTTVILSELVKSILDPKKILLNFNPMEVKNEINKECEKAVEILKSQATQIKDKEQLKNIASVSMENETVGEIIADMFDKLGKDAVVNVEIGSGFEIESEIKDGVDFPFGTISPYFLENGKDVTLNKTLILATNIKINQINQIKPLVQGMIQSGKKDLVIVAEHFDKEVIVWFIQLKITGQFNAVLVKVPMGKPEFFEDITSITNTEIVDESASKLEEVSLNQLGLIEKCIIDKDKTVLIGKSSKVETLINELKEKLKTEKSEYEKDLLKKRIAKLEGKIGIISVGAKTESEKEYLKLKVDDAVSATKCALEEGYVKGGGLALKEVAEKMKDSIIHKALMSPYNKIRENAGKDIEVPEKVIDPVKITRIALETACEIAGIFITTNVAIADKVEKPKDTE